MSLDSINLNNLSVDELNELIKEARQIKSQKSTPSIKLNAYVASVGKHVDAALQAIRKLMDADGVPQKKWDEVHAQLERIQLDNYRDSASKVKLITRSARGSRRK